MENLFKLVNLERVINETLKLVEVQNTAGNTVEIANQYELLLENSGFTVQVYEFIPNNPTIVARYQGNTNPNGKTIIFNGHMDVITLGHTPPHVEGNKIYGRGTCDMKGSLASILEVARVLKQAELEIDGEIIIIANSMHESPGGRGEDLTALTEQLDLNADAVVVMEGATYDCTVAQLGSATFNIRIEREGEPSHQLFTLDGTPHPISVLAAVIQSLEKENESLKRKQIEDIGNASYFIGNVQSGNFYNQMPNKAFLEGVRRYGPEESYDEVEDQMRQILNELASKYGVSISLEMKKVRDGYRIDKAHDLVKALQKSVKQTRGIALPLVGKKLVTDAGIFVKGMNIPAICYGPDQSRAHSETEYVEISELKQTINVYLQLIHEYLGIKF
ncbi:succinyl-diaminopimelate desuccinylase [Virgibacillus halotolerans]|uniref:M20 family metallopeptidase n=1 Tax=Virgibacillus halotolerans TaxID=1071053 RepID=UPI001960E331|nr:M20 family metallopeptidase [Virgibacillus halotolerans]MBM7600106.1 succinyl-diaminopimelate desuccinylase [Virgibacillus halotolerans]